MPKTIIPSQLSATVERVTNAQQFELVNGERVKRGSDAGEIQSAAKILRQHSGDPPPPRGATLNLAAFGVLSSLGITLSHEKRSYSLLDDQTNTQVVENISIFDPIYATLTNTAVEAKDKFSNNKDPFYELDDGPPSDEKQRRDKILEDKLTPKVEKITVDLIKLNWKGSLKQFTNAKEHPIPQTESYAKERPIPQTESYLSSKTKGERPISQTESYAKERPIPQTHPNSAKER